MCKTVIRIKESNIINEKERTIVISVLDTVDDETTKEVMRRVKALSPDEIVKQTKWLDLSELDKRTGCPDLAFEYQHGILLIDYVRVLVTMGKIVKCVERKNLNVQKKN
jgi:hypothetical protein